MKCEQCIEALSALIDEALDSLEEQQVMSHLEECTTCKETYLALCLIQKEMSNIEQIILPEGFHKEMMERVAKEKQNPLEVVIKPFRWSKKLIGYSGLVAAALLLFVTFETNEPNEPLGAATMELSSDYAMQDETEINPKIKMETGIMTVGGEGRVGALQEQSGELMDYWVITIANEENLYKALENKMLGLNFILFQSNEDGWLITVNEAKEKDELRALLMEIAPIEVLEEEPSHTAIRVSVKK